MEAGEVLAHLIERYLSSRDFNGVRASDLPEDAEPVAALVAAGEVEVFSELNSVNPAIRMIPSTRTADEMISDLRRGIPHTWLYPSAHAMSSVDLSEIGDEPYRLRLALGAAQLDF